MKDRRIDFRDLVSLVVQLVDPALGILTFRARDLSKSGAFLERTDPSTPLSAVGTKVHLTIKSPLGPDGSPVEVDANIVRQGDDGVAARFIIE